MNKAGVLLVTALLATQAFAADPVLPTYVENVTVSVLHEFHHELHSAEGWQPGAIAIDADGALYGTTATGGTYGAGTVFRIRRDGAFETIHVFKGRDGYRPDPCLVSRDGALYGTTGMEYSMERQRTFRITPEGVVQPLAVMYREQQTPDSDKRSLCGRVRGYNYTPSAMETLARQATLDMPEPWGRPVFGLLAARDGFLYGLLQGGSGGVANRMFRVRPNGPTEIVHVFDRLKNGPAQLAGPITFDPSDNSFYVTEVNGGAHEQGKVYRVVVPPAK